MNDGLGGGQATLAGAGKGFGAVGAVEGSLKAQLEEGGAQEGGAAVREAAGEVLVAGVMLAGVKAGKGPDVSGAGKALVVAEGGEVAGGEEGADATTTRGKPPV